MTLPDALMKLVSHVRHGKPLPDLAGHYKAAVARVRADVGSRALTSEQKARLDAL